MRKYLFLSLLIIVLLFPLGVNAQDPLTLSTLQIQIWPEYDKPGVLVIYRITLPADTTFPAQVSIRIPSASGEPNAVAVLQPDGELYNVDKTRQVVGDWAIISFSANAPEIQLEYYDQGLSKVDNAHHYKYVWPGDYAVSQLTIQVQQPLGATDMRISPSLGAGVVGNDNLTYYTSNIGAIPAGQTIGITLDYQKTSDTLSVENLPVQPSAPIPQGSAPDLTISTWLPWILGILGAGLIIGGIIWFWQSGRQRPAPQSRRRRSKVGSSQVEGKVQSSEGGIYCSKCGNRALPGDQFCRACGAAIRSR